MIAQPSAPPTNTEIEKALEAARNNVTVLEAEAVRLDRLIGSQKRELIGQEGAKRDIEDQIVLVEGKLAILETQYNSLKASSLAIEEENEAKRTELTAREEALATAELDLAGREVAVAGRELRVSEAESDLTTRNSAFEIVRDHHFEVVDRIKQAITSL